MGWVRLHLVAMARFSCCNTHEWPAFNQKGVAAFVATLTGTSNSPNDDSAIYRTSTPGQATEIVREGKAPPEGNGVFDQMLAPGQVNPILNETGLVAFRAALRGTSGGLNDNQGIYRGDGKTLTSYRTLRPNTDVA